MLLQNMCDRISLAQPRPALVTLLSMQSTTQHGGAHGPLSLSWQNFQAGNRKPDTLFIQI
jgi:hypothetical protein